VYLALDHHRAAATCFAAASLLEPENERWVYLLGVELQAAGESDAAIGALERAAELEPGYATTHARLALLHLEAGALELAASRYATYRGLVPDEPLGYVGAGRVALARGETDDAERWMAEAVRRDASDFLARRFHARALAAAGKPAEARAAMSVAESLPAYSGWLSHDPRLWEAHRAADHPRWLETVMRASRAEGDLPSFLRAAGAYLERRPTDVNILGMVAEVGVSMGQLDMAASALARALRVEPDDPGLHTVGAKLALARGQLDEATAAVDRALDLDRAYAPAHELRGRILFARGDAAAAAAAVLRAVELDPRQTASRMTLVEIHARSGRTDLALAVLAEVLEREPGNVAARDRLHELSRATPSPVLSP
jgi:tetratricopeptide (TPR) repeat protein